jgi:phosphopantetheinyl transferase
VSSVALHLMVLDVATVPPAVENRSVALMSPQELLALDARATPERRRQFALGRALMRAALSCRSGVPVSAWRFALRPGGQPVVEAPADAAHLRISLSHARGLMVCAVTEDIPVGVDVEPEGELLAAAPALLRALSPLEARAASRMAQAGRRRFAAERWLLKEAYTKALGTGLACSLAGLCFGGRREPAGAQAAPWSFRRMRFGTHLCMLAAQTPAGFDGEIRDFDPRRSF